MRDLKVGDFNLRPGERSWDGSYTKLTFESDYVGYMVESTVDDDAQIILVTPEVRDRRAAWRGILFMNRSMIVSALLSAASGVSGGADTSSLTGMATLRRS